MSGCIITPDTPETRYTLQKLARLQMIIRLEADILMDMKICDLEGWDRMEFIRQLQEIINSYGKKDKT